MRSFAPSTWVCAQRPANIAGIANSGKQQEHGPHGAEQHHRHEQLQHEPSEACEEQHSEEQVAAVGARALDPVGVLRVLEVLEPGRAAAERDQLGVERESVQVAELERDRPDEVADRDARDPERADERTQPHRARRVPGGGGVDERLRPEREERHG